MAQIITLGSGFPTENFKPEAHWQPFVDADACTVGFVCTRLSDGKKVYLYMNPSSSGDGAPDVFLYMGKEGNPVHDESLHFYEVRDEDFDKVG